MDASNLTVLVQDEVRGEYDISSVELDCRVIRFDAGSGRSKLLEDLLILDRQMVGQRLVLFCSLDAAAMIRNHCPELARGLVLNQRFLHWHVYAPLMPQGLLLNQTFFMLPFGMMDAHGRFIEKSFGDRIFFRPDSPGKEFPGTVTHINDLSHELSAIGQIFNPDPGEMTIICPARDLPDFEYRFWMIDGKAISPAGYSFRRNHADAPECPQEILNAASLLARHLEAIDNAVVADFVLQDEKPCLMELNGFSTSGFYPSMDFNAVCAAINDLMV